LKKKLSLLLVFALVLSIFTACGKQEATKDENNAGLPKIIVGASTTPHAEILREAADLVKEVGFELVIKEFDDYVIPNLSLESKELDANFFQHKPYLDDFNAEQGTNIVSVAQIHFEPLGIYPGKTKTLEELQDGAQVAVPNDTTNEARGLLLLEAQGLIKLKEDAGIKATVLDIVENPKNLKIVEIEAAQLARSLPDVDIAVINGNYAIKAGLNVSKDALAKEEATSLAAKTYANIVAVRAGDENSDKTKALVKALQSEKVKKFIEETYEGAVVPVF